MNWIDILRGEIQRVNTEIYGVRQYNTGKCSIKEKKIYEIGTCPIEEVHSSMLVLIFKKYTH